MCDGVILRIPNLRMSIIGIFFRFCGSPPQFRLIKTFVMIFFKMLEKICWTNVWFVFARSHGGYIRIFNLDDYVFIFLSEIVRLASVSIQYLYKSNLSPNFDFVNVIFDSSMLCD